MGESSSAAQRRAPFTFTPGVLNDRVNERIAEAERAIAGLYRRAPDTWSTAPDIVKKIEQRLGWLYLPRTMREALTQVERFAESVRRDGITDVVLLGMGGSSLAPEVLRAVAGVASGAPRFTMLDSTDPAAVAAVSPRLKQTLFILASKSGTTIEPNSLAAHFADALTQAGVAVPGHHFVAITDPGTELAERATRESFRETFINPADIGGRYSALSLFGLVPSALMGQDVSAFLDWGAAMLDACDPAQPLRDNPGAMLGLAMAAGASAGRDKLTLLVPPALEPFGLWVEQLVAESTGKQGVGVIPIAGERVPESARAYDDDRIFVHVRDARAAKDVDRLASEIASTGAPVLTIDLPEHAALGGEFLRWEIATAVAGAILGINPFDEPNVQTAKDATNALLGEFQKNGALPQAAADETMAVGTTLTLSTAARRSDAAGFLNTLAHGDYLAVLAYLGPDPSFLQPIADFRNAVRDRTRRATMFGYGPRYLHSTGQLHKGGPNTGVFVLVTATPARDLPVPGRPFSFGTLELAQALGDFASLDRTGRRALHVHLPRPDAQLLQSAFDVLLKSMKSSG